MKKRIKDVADIRVGYQFRGKVTPDPGSNLRVIQIRDIGPDRRIRVADLSSVHVDRPGPYVTQRGDVVFLNRGHRLYAVAVPDVPPNTVATGYFLILRPKAGVVMPEYLAWSMNQVGFQQSLRPFLRGSRMPMVSKSDVEGLRILLPPLVVQAQIMRINDLLDRERQLSAEIQDRRKLLVQAAARKLMLEADGERNE